MSGIQQHHLRVQRTADTAVAVVECVPPQLFGGLRPVHDRHAISAALPKPANARSVAVNAHSHQTEHAADKQHHDPERKEANG